MVAKTIAILGAGMAGIRTAKEAKDAGFVPTVFDKSSYIGGVWSPSGYTWDNMHTNIGTYSMTLTDFPWPDNELMFANSRRVYQYLLSYIEHFDLKSSFRLETQIQSLKQLDDERWQITSVKDGVASIDVFDFYVVSTGMNSKPTMPSFENKGLNDFKGLLLHAGDYKSNDARLKAKRVLVVGGSASGTEIASELVGHAESVSMAIRTNYLVFPKMIKKKTEDDLFTVTSLECLVMNRKTYYGGLPDPNADEKTKQELMNRKKQAFKMLSPIQTSKELAPSSIYMDLEAVGFPDFSISQDFVDLVQKSRINVHRGEISSFRSNGVVLTDGSFIEVDVILCATSYQLDFSYFDESVLTKLNYEERCGKNPILMYKNTWHPDLPNIAFVGMFKTIAWAVVGLQAEWVMKIFSKQMQLPPRDVALKGIDEEFAKRVANPHVQFPYSLTYLCDMFAKELGRAPDLERLKQEDPQLYEYLWTGPILVEHFQLNEPDQLKREKAIRRIKHINEVLNHKYSREEADAIEINQFYLR